MRIRMTSAGMTVLLAAGLLTGCGGDDRWCEHDDARVDNSFCESGTDGYEWETAGDDGSSKRTYSRPGTSGNSGKVSKPKPAKRAPNSRPAPRRR